MVARTSFNIMSYVMLSNFTGIGSKPVVLMWPLEGPQSKGNAKAANKGKCGGQNMRKKDK